MNSLPAHHNTAQPAVLFAPSQLHPSRRPLSSPEDADACESSPRSDIDLQSDLRQSDLGRSWEIRAVRRTLGRFRETSGDRLNPGDRGGSTSLGISRRISAHLGVSPLEDRRGWPRDEASVRCMPREGGSVRGARGGPSGEATAAHPFPCHMVDFCLDPSK